MASRNRGKKKLKLRDLSLQPLTSAEKLALINAVSNVAHPVSAAILGAVMVEHELEVSIRKKFKRQDDETWASLVGERGSLGTFSAKISMGYAFGLYDEATLDNLNVVRHIRNAFAHSKKVIDFDHELVAAELEKATALSKKFKRSLKKHPTKQTLQFAYVMLCQRLALKFMRKRTRALKASTYQKARKALIKRYPFSSPDWSNVLGLSPQAEKESPWPPPLLPQTGDPKTSARAGLLGDMLHRLATESRNKGKKD